MNSIIIRHNIAENVAINTLFNINLDDFSSVVSIARLHEAFREVKRNRGAPGIDGVTVADFETHLTEELDQISKELQNWSYKPKPVRRVDIPKPTGGVRSLGIPCVRDRVVQASIKLTLEPKIEPHFSDSSFGFRPGRNQHQAVLKAQEYVQGGKEWVVDIDLEKFFDRINHDLLIFQLKQYTTDTKLLRLIGLTLRSGVMADGIVSATNEGSVQGSPLSPLLSNVMLDVLDKELELRGLSFCRYADDANVFVSSKEAGKRVFKSIIKFVETKLKVNLTKSKVAKSKYVKFLGFTIIFGTIAIASKPLAKAMETVRTLTPRNTCISVEATLKQVNKWYKGWAQYYAITQYPAQFNFIESRVRRRLRARIIRQHKRGRYLKRKLLARGLKPGLAYKTAYSSSGIWRKADSNGMEKAFSNHWFKTQGQYLASEQTKPFWFSKRKWIALP